MKRYSRLAVLSFAAGCLGWWGAVTRGGGGLSLLALLCGVAAFVAGIIALATVRPKDPQVRGRALAVSAVGLGLMTVLWSLAGLAGLILQQFSPGQFERPPWEQNRRAEDGQPRNRMPDKPAADFTSNLPIIVLETSGQGLSKHRQTPVHAKIFDVENGRSSIAGKAVYDGLATIHLRGYSTLHLPKRSYTFHTVDENTNQVKVPLLGLPAEEDWVLYAPYEDKTLMRDVLAYELARRMGHYAPRTRYVELFMPSGDHALSMRDYAGIYVLVEKIKRGKHRVNIASLKEDATSEPEISGGYIVKRDHSERPESTFRSRRGGPFSYVYPKPANITPAQKRWLRQYFNALESALYGDDFTEPKTGYAAYLDVDSFIDAHWLIELSKNVDGFRYSSFLTKDRGGKLKTEPPWDWNRAFGNANYYDGGEPRGWYWPKLRPNEISWFERLRQDPNFMQRCNARWRELRKDALDPKKIQARIDELAAQLEEAQTRNFRRWPVLGRQVTCNHFVGDTYEEEVRWLKKWIERRITWIDGQVARAAK